MAVHKRLVGAAGRFYQAHRRLVQLFDSLVTRFIFTAHQRDFAVAAQRLREPRGELALQRDRDAAQGDIALFGQKIGGQGFPRGWHPLHLRIQAAGQ